MSKIYDHLHYCQCSTSKYGCSSCNEASYNANVYLANIRRLNEIATTKRRNISWKSREKYAEATENINYKCGFDGVKCKKLREIDNTRLNNSSIFSRIKACCSRCMRACGYLDAIPIKHKDEIIKLYNSQHGFWTPEGCALPRKWRSVTCLIYVCCEKDKLSDKDYRILQDVKQFC